MFDNSYSWKNVRYGSARKVSSSDSLMRWILIAVLLAIVCHIVVLLAMKKMPVLLDSSQPENVITQSVVVRNVLDREYIEPPKETKSSESLESSEIAKNLLEEIEMLEEAPEDTEIDFSPTIEEPEILVPIEAVALAGDVNSSAQDVTTGLDFSENIEDLGSTDTFLKPAVGQITIDPGKQAADEFDPDEFNTELAKGAGGQSKNGVMEGFTPLAEMTRLSQSDLEKAKGMIGSDLLYDFNKATLRESAKNSLLKVVLIIDKNPNMKCWIEGHTDLIGTDEANAKLSLARAKAVKHWLVHSMKISEDRLFVRGLGMSQPVVLSGDQDAQAVNRRVEIKMRKNPPSDYLDSEDSTITKKPRIIKPLRNPNLPDGGSDISIDSPPSPVIPPALPEPPKAVPVEEDLTAANEEPKAPKAIPVEDVPLSTLDEPNPPKAIPVE